jgi:tetraacyldisaccharide 4'-kinase
VAGVTRALAGAAAAVYGTAWEARRRAYAAGLLRPRAAGARVVSIGNLTAGGTGKTTLTLHLAQVLLASGADPAVVCRRYRPGPDGRADEELLYAAALGADRVYAGRVKWRLARAAAAAGRSPVLVDDGFSHWALERDVDLVLIDASDPWGGGDLLPVGRLREPRRALQRAEAVVLTRVTGATDVASLREQIRRYAPAARLAAGRHRPAGVLDGQGRPARAAGPAVVVTATGNPEAVRRTATEAGFAPVRLSAYRDHHWFHPAEARAEERRAAAAGETLLVTAKDAVRWPAGPAGPPAVLAVAWEWVEGGREIETLVSGGTRR